MQMQPFEVDAKTLPVSVTSTASASVALPSKGNSIRIVNEGPNAAFVSVGLGTQVATIPTSPATRTSTPVLVGYDLVFSLADVNGMEISAITRTGTAVLDVTVAEGS